MTLFEDEEALPAALKGPPVRVRMTVAYDGRGFHGFTSQAGVKTVGGQLTTSLERILGHRVTLTCAGRTDAGVHAWGQVVSFDADAERFVPLAVTRSLNRMLAPAIVVRAAAAAADGFDARRGAVSRTYRYTVLNRPYPDPFLAPFAWHVEDPLDVRAMALACDAIIGEHDFSSFCRKPRLSAMAVTSEAGEGPSMVRRVVEARWAGPDDDVLCFEITASSFCQQMVRALVGTMVDMGSGRKRAGEMLGILRRRSRSGAGRLAPPHGLCLWDVSYTAPA